MPYKNADIRQLNKRRAHLGISQSRLAEMTGLSLPTIQRFFSEHRSSIPIEAILKIIESLGMTLAIKEVVKERTLLEKQARKKAHTLANMVQATSALEAQVLTAKALKQIEDKLFHDLMTGSKRRLWSP